MRFHLKYWICQIGGWAIYHANSAVKNKNTKQPIIKRIASPGDDAGNNKYEFSGKRPTKKGDYITWICVRKCLH